MDAGSQLASSFLFSLFIQAFFLLDLSRNSLINSNAQK